MATKVGDIFLALGVDTKKAKTALSVFSKDARKQARGIEGAFSGIAATIATALSVRAVVNFSKECISLGSDIAEVQNVVDVAFGSMTYKMEEFAATSIETYGISQLAAKQTGSNYMAMAKGMGVAEEAASDMAISLTALSADMASFYNVEQSEAKTALASVFTGETETLKKYGVVMTEVNLQEFARQKGITKSISKMTQQEKTLLRYQYVLQSTSLAAGDFARTQNSWANQTRILDERFNQVKATLGQGLINALTPAIQVLNELMSTLQMAADAFLDLTVAMFGDAGGGGSTSAAATAASSMAESTEQAAQSAKDYAKSMAGFDKLNVLGKKSSGGGSSSDDTSSTLLPGGSSGGGSITSGYDTSAMQNTLVDIALIVGAASLALGAILTFTCANIPLGLGLMALGAASLVAAVAINSKAIEEPVASALDLITTVVSAALLAIGAILALTGVNIPLGVALMAAGAVGLVAVAATNWDATTNEVKMAITGIASFVGTALLVVGAVLAFSGVALPLGIGLMAAGAVSLGSAVALNWNAASDGASAVVSTIASIVGGALLALGALLAFTGVALPLGLALMAAGAVSLASAIAPNWTGISDQTRNTITLISGIAGAALLAIGVILLLTGAGIPLGLGLIAAGAASLATAIAPNWDAIVTTVGGVCDTLGQIFTGLWNGIVDGFKFCVNGLISYANLWIDGLNFLLTPVRDLIVFIAEAFGKSLTLEQVALPHIPMLANGGYVKANSPQFAMIGDNRHQGEIVAPEGKITEAVVAALGPFADILRQLGATIKAMPAGNGQPIVVKCYLDGRVFYETMVKESEARRRVSPNGRNPLMW